MGAHVVLRNQIVTDIENLATMEDLIASGETKLQVSRDRLESAIQIKVAILHGLEKELHDPFLELDEDEGGLPL